MHIFRYIATLLLAATTFVAAAWSGVTSHRDIELPRGEIFPFNSDSLMTNDDRTTSLYVSAVEGWRQSSSCDTLYEAKYVFPFEWLNREVILRVGYVDAPYTVEINGERVAEVSSGSSRVEFNVTRQTIEGANEVALRLSPNSKSRMVEGWRESSELRREPIDDVMVIAAAKMSVRDIFTRTSRSEDVMSSAVGVVLKSYNLNERISVWRYRMRNAAGELVANGMDTIELRYRGEDTLYLAPILPKSAAWRDGSPSLHRLDIELMHEGRVAELHRLKLGFRELTIEDDGAVKINGDEVKLRVKEIAERVSRAEIMRLAATSVNTLLFGAGYESEGLYEALTACDEAGLYAIVTSPINSSPSGDNIAVGGNVTNDPAWYEEYCERLERGYYSVRRHPSVIAYNMASESLNGYNLYEGYLHLKSIQSELPILNLDGGGEWNGDRIEFEMIK